MKRLALFLFAIMFFLLCTPIQEVITMPAKVTEKVFLPGVIEEFRKIFGRKIITGPAADEGSELAKYAAANEFGATITPKSARFLAIPMTKEAKNGNPRDFDLFVYKSSSGGAFLARTRGKSIELMYILKSSVTIPERSYIRSAFDKQETVDKAIEMGRAALARLLGGSGSAEDVLNAIGASLAASVKSNIASSIGPPNSTLTVSLKRGSTTLVDEGQLLKSISYEVI